MIDYTIKEALQKARESYGDDKYFLKVSPSDYYRKFVSNSIIEQSLAILEHRRKNPTVRPVKTYMKLKSANPDRVEALIYLPDVSRHFEKGSFEEYLNFHYLVVDREEKGAYLYLSCDWINGFNHEQVRCLASVEDDESVNIGPGSTYRFSPLKQRINLNLERRI